MGPVPEGLINLKVSELILENRGDWNREMIRSIIPQYEEEILKIKFSKTGAPDRMIWLKNNSGEYSVKSGYWTAIEQEARDGLIPPQLMDWNKGIWKLEVAPKVKVFLWKCFQRALPVGERLLARGIPLDPKCVRCDTTESIHHLFFQCEFAKKVWDLAPFADPIDSSGLIDLAVNWNDLLGMSCLPPIGISATILTPWLLWALWNARNNLLFNKKASSPSDVVTKAIVAAREWIIAQEPCVHTSRKVKTRMTIHEDCYQLQTDAAWQADSGLAGLGWTIKKEAEKFSFASHCYYVTSPLVAEALAVREALGKCRELGLQRLICETDSSQLVAAISSGIAPPDVYGIVADILSTMTFFDVICFRWISRGSNKEADALAKQALFAETVVMNQNQDPRGH